MRLFVILGAAALLMGTTSVDDAFERAVAALAHGSRAADVGDTARLKIAARDLHASAAMPFAGDDLAAQWLRQAHAAPPTPDRDRALGPGYRSLALSGGAAARFEQTFLAGRRARVAIVPARRAGFVLRVTDDDHATVCSASPDHALCDWVPSYTTRFQIEVSNPGPQAGRYFVVMQ